MNQQETILHYLNQKDSEKLKELVSGMEESRCYNCSAIYPRMKK